MKQSRLGKQIIGQSLISPISAPPRQRQMAWTGPAPAAEPIMVDSIGNHSFQQSSYSSSSSPIMIEWTPMDMPRELLPNIAQFMNAKTLAKLLVSCKEWCHILLPILYSHLEFKKYEAKRFKKLLALLLQPDTFFNYESQIKSLSLFQISFTHQDDACLVWKDVQLMLELCGHSLNQLYMELDDHGFLDLPLDHKWLTNSCQFTELDTLQIHSGNSEIPESFVIEILRHCSPQSLLSLDISQCCLSFQGTAWYLLLESISPNIKKLILTPSTKSKGWDADQFQKGLLQIVKTSAQLETVDISGHRFGITDKSLCILMELAQSLQTLVLPCGLNDTHLITLMGCSNIGKLKKLDLSCKCTIGRFTEIKKEGWPCNKFTDSVLIALLEKCMSDNKELRKELIKHKAGYERMQLVLPRFIMDVKSGKKIPTISWATNFRGYSCDYKDKDAIYFKGFRIYSPGSRLIL